MQIVIGSGNYIISGIMEDGREGIRIAKAPNHNQPIDSVASLGETVEAEEECTLWFTDLKAARLFQDHANSVCLRLNHYTVENVKGE